VLELLFLLGCPHSRVCSGLGELVVWIVSGKRCFGWKKTDIDLEQATIVVEDDIVVPHLQAIELNNNVSELVAARIGVFLCQPGVADNLDPADFTITGVHKFHQLLDCDKHAFWEILPLW